MGGFTRHFFRFDFTSFSAHTIFILVSLPPVALQLAILKFGLDLCCVQDTSELLSNSEFQVTNSAIISELRFV